MVTGRVWPDILSTRYPILHRVPGLSPGPTAARSAQDLRLDGRNARRRPQTRQTSAGASRPAGPTPTTIPGCLPTPSRPWSPWSPLASSTASPISATTPSAPASRH